MPYLPELPTWEKSIINTQQFLGLNRGLSIGDGEMADMLNMSSDNFPVLSTRQPRGVPKFDYNAVVEPVFAGQIDGMLGTDRLVVCHDGKVYVNGKEVPITLSTEPAMRDKRLVSMGAYICIWPDKKYFNINNYDDSGDMGSKWEAAEDGVVSAMMCRRDGTDYDMTKIPISATAPEDPQDKDFWLDTSGENDVLKQYSYVHKQWVQVATTYIKIEAPGIGKDLKDFDSVWLSGVSKLGVDNPESIVTYKGKDVELVSSYKYTVHITEVQTSGEYSTPTKAEDTQVIKVTGLPEGAVVKKAVISLKSSGTTVNGEDKHVNARVMTVNGISFDVSAGEKNIPIDINKNGDFNLKFVYQTETDSRHGFQWVDYTDTMKLSLSDISVAITYESTDASDKDNKELERINNTSNIVYGRGDDYIIIAGLLHQALTLNNTLVAEMRVPDMDYVCESGNRIWGCLYAEEDGTVLNEIHACAAGDFRNWFKFQGTAADSYTMTVGSDGVFTGAYALQGVPIFFKESFIHRVSGTIPANYTLNTIRGRGVQEGSWKSLTTVNETLFYKSRNDVMAYEGAMPYSVGEKLGKEAYGNAVGGGHRDKYYLCMQDENLKWHTYVLDTSKGLWHQEGTEKISFMAAISGELVLAVEGTETTDLRTVSNRDDVEETFSWSVTFGVMGFQSEQQKYLSRYNIRAQMSAGSHMKVEMQYDSDGKWHHMGTMKSPKLRTFLLPIIPRRCDHCQLRISGTGKINIYSVAREYENGGDG